MNAIAEFGLRDCQPTQGRAAVSRGSWRDIFRRRLGGWLARQEGRRALALLTERDFHDMGRTRSELEYELAKPVWRG